MVRFSYVRKLLQYFFKDIKLCTPLSYLVAVTLAKTDSPLVNNRKPSKVRKYAGSDSTYRILTM